MKKDIKEKRKKRNNKGKKENKILKFIAKVIITIIILGALFVGGFVGYSVYKNGWGLKGLLQTAVGQSDEQLKELEEFRVLILGISEDISSELTDTIMVASYNPRTQKAVLLSIPRDTFVGDSKLSADSYDKINAIYQKEGPEGTLEKVNEITGLDIKYYLVISNNALADLVDAIGGVEFDVPINMDYDSKKQDLHIHLEKGLQTLNGEQAEGLVRFRKNNNGTTYPAEYGSDDYGRMKTQREFIKAVAKQTLKAQNITKVGNLIDVVKENVETNIRNWSDIKDYIPYAIEFEMSNLQTETIPGVSDRIPANTGLWFFIHDEEETEELIKELYTEQNEENAENVDSEEQNNTENENSTEKNDTTASTNEIKNVKIEILNGSGESTLLTDATNSLKSQGYTIYKTGTTSTTSKTTIINKDNVDSDTMLDIKSILGVGIISSSSSSSNSVDVTIILGKDYDG